MPEGAEGYTLPQEHKHNRRTFLATILKVGAGATAAATGLDILPGQKTTSVEAASPEKKKVPQKEPIIDIDATTKDKPVGTRFQILVDSNLDNQLRVDLERRLIPFAQVGGTAVSVTEELIKKAKTGDFPQEQVDSIVKLFADAERQAFEILYHQTPLLTPKP